MNNIEERIVYEIVDEVISRVEYSMDFKEKIPMEGIIDYMLNEGGSSSDLSKEEILHQTIEYLKSISYSVEKINEYEYIVALS